MTPDSLRSRVIRPAGRWTTVDLREIWASRELLFRLAARDVTLRYRQTVLGVTWVIVQPLLAAGVLAFVFGNVAGFGTPRHTPYFAFSLVGMVLWNGFSQTTIRASTSMLSNAAMVQKVFFPRLLLPLSALASVLVDVAVSLVLVAVVVAMSGITPGLALLMLPLWIAAALAAGLGVGLVAAALMVPYRDVQHIVPVGIQLLLFMSPVAYALHRVPTAFRGYYQLNPLVGLLEGLRWSLLQTAAPSTRSICTAFGGSLALLVVGLLVFHRLQRVFADVI